MNYLILLTGLSVFFIGLYGLNLHSAYSLSCEVDGQGNCISISTISSPLKQYKSGVGLGDVFCNLNLTFVVKQNSGIPACVHNADKLIERGWATTLDDYIIGGPEIEIMLNKGPCYGYCPTYSITITNDGTLVFEGYENLKTIGIEIDKISTSDIANLVSYINNIDYFTLENLDDPPISDIPRTTTSVTIGDKTNTITNIQGEYGIPKVSELEAMINDIANSQNRIDGTIFNDYD